MDIKKYNWNCLLTCFLKSLSDVLQHRAIIVEKIHLLRHRGLFVVPLRETRTHYAVNLTLFQCSCKLGLQFEAIDPPHGPIMPLGEFDSVTFNRTLEIASTEMSIHSHAQYVQLCCLQSTMACSPP